MVLTLFIVAKETLKHYKTVNSWTVVNEKNYNCIYKAGIGVGYIVFKTSEELITNIVKNNFKSIKSKDIIKNSYLLQYLIKKMKSVSASSKARNSFGSIYPIYVLVEDYLLKGFDTSGNYRNYDGVNFTDIMNKQRQLPFGEKLQNHAVNNRINDDFKKYFLKLGFDGVPIIRDIDKSKYWINEELILIKIGDKTINIGQSIINIIEKYIEAKVNIFEDFLNQCTYYMENLQSKEEEAKNFILGQLNIEVDARIFEIVSFAILKYYYINHKVLIGFDKQNLKEEKLQLYKTGRTNANDGGIDFVMNPVGRFFQVTEVLDFKKYFLDIDKVNKYPMTFVIKSLQAPDVVMEHIKKEAIQMYKDGDVLEKYLSCFEEVITIPTLVGCLDNIIKNNNLAPILNELIIQYKVEYNISA